MTLDLDAIKARLAGMAEAASLVVTTCGTVEIDGEERDAIVLEGSRDAIREATKWFGDDVVIAPAAARTDIPALIAEVERLRGVLCEARTDLAGGLSHLGIDPSLSGTIRKIDALLKGTDDD